MPSVHLVTQGYGAAAIRDQALYAMWSTLAFADGLPIRLHAYTDDPAPFAPLAEHVEVRVLSPEEIRAWRGPHGFVHRLKVELLREMVSRFPGEPLFYVDADVFFTGPVSRVLERLGPGRAVMHEREYPVATHGSSQMRKFRRQMRALSFRGRSIDLSCDMWNAGALGIHPADAGVLEEWIEFIDEIYPRYGNWIVEQFAISSLLQRNARVASASDVVFHYWFQTRDYDTAVRRALVRLRTMPYRESLAHLRANTIRLPYRKQTPTFLERMRRICGVAR